LTRYQKRRTEPVPAGVCDDDALARVEQGEEIEVVLARLSGRVGWAGGVEPGQRGRGFGDESLLNSLRNAEFRFLHE
jgi:hypothetical protein